MVEIIRKLEELVGQVSRVTDLMELLEAVCENGSFEPVVYKCDLFTKTGSGQT